MELVLLCANQHLHLFHFPHLYTSLSFPFSYLSICIVPYIPSFTCLRLVMLMSSLLNRGLLGLRILKINVRIRSPYIRIYYYLYIDMVVTLVTPHKNNILYLPPLSSFPSLVPNFLFHIHRSYKRATYSCDTISQSRISSMCIPFITTSYP